MDVLHDVFERGGRKARVEIGGRPVWKERIAAAVPLADVSVGDCGAPAQREGVLKRFAEGATLWQDTNSAGEARLWGSAFFSRACGWGRSGRQRRFRGKQVLRPPRPKTLLLLIPSTHSRTSCRSRGHGATCMRREIEKGAVCDEFAGSRHGFRLRGVDDNLGEVSCDETHMYSIDPSWHHLRGQTAPSILLRGPTESILCDNFLIGPPKKISKDMTLSRSSSARGSRSDA